MSRKARSAPPSGASLVSLDRRVIRQGGTRVLSLGKVLPPDWLYVRISVIEKDDKSVTLLLERLVGNGKGAVK